MNYFVGYQQIKTFYWLKNISTHTLWTFTCSYNIDGRGSSMTLTLSSGPAMSVLPSNYSPSSHALKFQQVPKQTETNLQHWTKDAILLRVRYL